MKFNMTSFGGGGGLVYFINEHIGMELSARYLIRSQKENDNHSGTDDMDHKGFQIALGTIVSF